MNDPHDNHTGIEERFDELVRGIAADGPTDAQWTAAHNRLRRRLAAQPQSSVISPRYWFLWRALAYGFGAAAMLAIISIPLFMLSGRSAQAAEMSSPGQLIAIGPNGAPAGICPLAHTDVVANVAGFVARVSVRQTFTNPFDRPIEAVYEFPLPQGSAVDQMTMRIGARVIVGQVKEKQEARKIYNEARAAGQRAALLEQHRPNIFSQSVANIQPGEKIEIEIGYNEVLGFVDGRFEFVFPMVIAPRYDSRPAANGDSTHTPDGAPVQTQYADMTTSSAPATRSGHDISVTVKIAGGGMQIQELTSRLHEVVTERPRFNEAIVKLKNESEIPNRDFVLNYTMTSDEIGDALFLRDDPRGRFFTLILAPPKRVTPKDVAPRELIFVIDQSGSMGGWKIEKAKLAMRRCIQNLNPGDTFNLLSFSGGVGRCFEKPVPATSSNIAAALAYLDSMAAGGGTEMMPAIMEALTKQTASDRTRIVGFMSDGEIGNDFEILSAVRQNAGTSRVFTFGVGDSVNRFLLETMAKTSRGEAQWVTESDKPEAAADRFYVSLSAPVLTDVKLEWQGLQVEDITPPLLPDLFDRRPIMIHGRIKKGSPMTGSLTLTGMTGSGPMRRVVNIPRDAAPTDNAALPSLWARSRVDQIMMESPVELQSGQFSPATREKIVGLGVEYQLMTQFTSFVAVEKNPLATKAEPVRVDVTAAAPQGEPRDTLGRAATGAEQKVVGFKVYASDASDYDNDGDVDMVFFAGDHSNTPSQPAAAPVRQLRMRPAATYDPTNGTSSSGDVYSYKDGGMAAPAAKPVEIGDKEKESQTDFFAYPNTIGLKTEVADELTSVESLVWTYNSGADSKQYPMPVMKIDPTLRETAKKLDGQTTGSTITVTVSLTDTSAETMKELAKLGFIIDHKLSNQLVVVGKIPANRLVDLARLLQVKTIAPYKRTK